MCITKKDLTSNELSKMWSTFFETLKLDREIKHLNSFVEPGQPDISANFEGVKMVDHMLKRLKDFLVGRYCRK